MSKAPEPVPDPIVTLRTLTALYKVTPSFVKKTLDLDPNNTYGRAWHDVLAILKEHPEDHAGEGG